MGSDKSNLLSVEGMSLSFGGVVALSDFELKVPKGELRAIIGPNGAGKTSLFNVISGFYKADRGNIYFAGEEVSRLDIHERAKRGITRTFQRSEIFEKMTVLENIMVGKHMFLSRGLASIALKTGRVRLEEKEKRRECYEIIDFLGLTSYKDDPASSLPFGMRKFMELGRALAANPRLLLLDEPAAGLNAKEISLLFEFVNTIRQKSDIAILLVEHNMRLVMEIAERITVLDHGVKIAEGAKDEVKNDPKVIEAYLGRSV